MAKKFAEYINNRYGERFPRTDKKETRYLVKRLVVPFWMDTSQDDLNEIINAVNETADILMEEVA